ncbi:MAG: hypothetical protein ACN0LA_08700 [Candidatus Longimicrobiales bacterium M2_2A_002]
MAAVFARDRLLSEGMTVTRWHERSRWRRAAGWLAARLQRWL